MNSFIEVANAAGLLDKDFWVEARIKTPAFAGQCLHLFGDNASGPGWNLPFNPSRAGDRKWEGLFSVGWKSWFENYALDPLTVHQIAVLRTGNSSQTYDNGNPPDSTLISTTAPSASNFFIGRSPAALPDPGGALLGVDVHAFRASSQGRYRGAFIPQRQFDKEDDTLILLAFSGHGTALKDRARDHDGRITNAI